MLQAIPVLFLISAIVFTVTYFIPGDPAMIVLGRARPRKKLASGAERLHSISRSQSAMAFWLSGLVQGELGNSILSRQPVTTLIGRALPITLYLTRSPCSSPCRVHPPARSPP